MRTMETVYEIRGDSLLLRVKAVPGASRSECAGVKDGRLRLRIAAAPEDGKANGELRAFLAKALGCPKREIRLLSGEKSRLKTLSLPAASREKLEALIGG
ncbi:MAG: DUF167 domain-containing protein [Spirochaetaceae bacterium]|nr:DUF167 domain-containing protein [Spirochaetaceae bacterium]